MKKEIKTLFMATTLTLILCSCGAKKSENSDNASDVETEVIQENALSDEQETMPEEAESIQNKEEGTFSFKNFENLQFCFSSGAGGWATYLTINEDGSFEGEFFDGDLGCTGDGYPNGTMYQSVFSGQFTQPVKVNAYTYSMKIQEITYEKAFGTEEIRDGMLYCYCDAYGLEEAEDILIYLPGAPLTELPEEFRSWVGYYDLSYTTDTELPFYALNNETQQYGFSSYNIVENIKESVASVEEWSVSLEDSLEDESLSQVELNDTSEQIYMIWDSTLNQLWNVLKQTLDPEAMEALTVEERAWIVQKEQAVKEAGAEWEGDSMQPLAENLKAAEMTKARVYELLEMLP